jgi:hypothetical protein
MMFYDTRGYMQEAIDETERKVIDILTRHPVTEDAWAKPIYAADKEMNWGTTRTKDFVRGLIKRGLIHWVPIVAKGTIYDPRACWKEGALNAR